MTARVFCICGDPGGAAALAPVLHELRARDNVALDVNAYGTGVAALARSGMPCAEWPPGLTDDDIRTRWTEAKPDALLCATSVNTDDYERTCIRLARTTGVPSLAVLDAWSNYARRFGTPDAPLSCVPDRIAVMDDRARREMEAVGFGSDRLAVTGQPAFDALATFRVEFDRAARRGLRERLAPWCPDICAAFFSQPIHALTSGSVGYRHPGYDERQVLTDLHAALAAIAHDRDLSISLLVKLHPREDLPALPTDTASLRSRLIKDCASRELMLMADIVVGMTSIALVEAASMDCPTVSLQPGALHPDTLASNLDGASYPVYRAEDIRAGVERMLFDDKTREEQARGRAAFAPRGGATERVIAELENMMHEARHGIACDP